jgi:hypothetical protein
MEEKLQGISMGNSWTTYMASAYGVMKAAGLWEEDISMLMGKTGMAFHFIVHEMGCPSSVTVYDWYTTHFNMMDIIGVYTDSFCVYNRNGMNTYAQARDEAASKIKASIDSGKGVVVWAPTAIPEFGIITGYSDEDRVFFVVDCMSGDPDPLLYDNLGRSEVPFLYIQCFHSRLPVDEEKVFRDSLQTGLYSYYHLTVSPQYASGPRAYDNLINALEQGESDGFGISYIINVYADAKHHCAEYLDYIAKHSNSLDNMDEPAACCRRAADYFKEMVEFVPFRGPGNTTLDRTVVPEIIELVKKAKADEVKGMEIIKKIVDGTI